MLNLKPFQRRFPALGVSTWHPDGGDVSPARQREVNAGGVARGEDAGP